MRHSALPIPLSQRRHAAPELRFLLGSSCDEGELAVGANAEGKAIDPVALVLLTGRSQIQGEKNEACVF